MKAVILAAGEGTRLNKGWTIVPKPLLEVQKKAIIEHVITSLKGSGITDILVVVGFMSEHIKDYLRDGVDYGVNITYVYNKNYKSDMVTSLKTVKDHIDGPFVLCMADLFFESNVVANLIPKAQTNHHYICVDKKINDVRRVEEKVKVQSIADNVSQTSLVLPHFDAVDCGIYLLQPSFFETLDQCMDQGKRSLPLVLSELAIQGKCKVHDIGEHSVLDIDREKDVEYVDQKVNGVNGA